MIDFGHLRVDLFTGESFRGRHLSERGVLHADSVALLRSTRLSFGAPRLRSVSSGAASRFTQPES